MKEQAAAGERPPVFVTDKKEKELGRCPIIYWR